jgi:hypothetical protein
LHKRNKQRIKGWSFVNERIVAIYIKEENEDALNEDDTEENRTQFYECLQRTFETVDRQVFLLGDMNASVGNN